MNERVWVRLRHGPEQLRQPCDVRSNSNRSCFIVRDNNGQALAYVYFETEPGRRTAANSPATLDEARLCSSMSRGGGKRRGCSTEKLMEVARKVEPLRASRRHHDPDRLPARRNPVARSHVGKRRLLVGGAHHGDQPSGCGSDLHDVEFGS